MFVARPNREINSLKKSFGLIGDQFWSRKFQQKFAGDVARQFLVARLPKRFEKWSMEKVKRSNQFPWMSLNMS